MYYMVNILCMYDFVYACVNEMVHFVRTQEKFAVDYVEDAKEMVSLSTRLSPLPRSYKCCDDSSTDAKCNFVVGLAFSSFNSVRLCICY